MQDDGDDPFDEGEVNLENPLQTPAAEDDSAGPTPEPMEIKRLFFEVRSPGLSVNFFNIGQHERC